MDADKFAKRAGLRTTSSARASWSALQKKLVAGSSSVVSALPTSATALQERKRPAYTIIDDSESEDILPTPKKRRRSTSTSSHRYHRSSDPYRSRSRKATDAEKTRQPAASHPFAVDHVEPALLVSEEPLNPEIARNTSKMALPCGNPDFDHQPATTKASTRTTAATIVNDSVGRNDAAVSSSRNNISGRSTTSKTMTKSAIQKTKDMVWNRTYKTFFSEERFVGSPLGSTLS